MLRTLSVRNYVLIDSLEIAFPEGLIIITGQTGAGKSILLGALSLVTGAKADAGCISEGADSCVVEAEFELGAEETAVRAILDENEVEWDDGHLIVRRVVNRSGRSRSFVNDSPVPVAVLQAISSRLIDIHSQHQSLLLADRQFQLSVLDRFAGDGDDLALCASLWRQLQSLRGEHRAAAERLARLGAEKAYNEAQFSQLEAAALREGELEELEAEQRQLSNAESIKTSLSSVVEMLDPADQDARPSVASVLRESGRLIGKILPFLPAAEPLVARLESSRIELEDILGEVDSLNSSVEVSQQRLETVEERMSVLYELMKKHSCRTIEELIEVRNRYGEALFDSDALEGRMEELQKQIDAASAELDKVAARLHSVRCEAASRLAAEVQDSIRFLELERAVFEVEVASCELSSTGADSVAFKFSSTGRGAVELSRCASGGEMSRIMLSLKSIMARFSQMPTLIFDEIDTGVSGSVADKMGSVICSMGGDMQVFAITHLPQVAAKGRAHYLVSKQYDEASGRTTSCIRQLEAEERVMEVARMLSGATVSAAAVANARELLSD